MILDRWYKTMRDKKIDIIIGIIISSIFLIIPSIISENIIKSILSFAVPIWLITIIVIVTLYLVLRKRYKLFEKINLIPSEIIKLYREEYYSLDIHDRYGESILFGCSYDVQDGEVILKDIFTIDDGNSSRFEHRSEKDNRLYNLAPIRTYDPETDKYVKSQSVFILNDEYQLILYCAKRQIEYNLKKLELERYKQITKV